MTNATELRTLVFQALDNAKANGYDDPTEPVEDVAINLMDYDAEIFEATRHQGEARYLGEIDCHELIPFIEEWRAKEAARR